MREFLSRFIERFVRNFWQIFVILAAYVPFLGQMSVPLTGDQKVYIATSMEMMAKESWLTPILFDAPSYYKPPFQYWMTILGWKIFGFNLWGTLLPSVFALAATAWCLSRITRKLIGRTQFSLVPLWFAAALGTVTYGTTSQMEIYLVLFYAAAWLAALKFLEPEPENRSWSWLFIAFGIAGLSSINKSPLYPVLWGIGLLTYLIVTGEWELFSRKRLYAALVFGMVVGLAWFAALLARDGKQFYSDYLIRETWAKNSGNDSSGVMLWVALSYMAFPMTLLCWSGFRALWKAQPIPRESVRTLGNLDWFVVSWAWAPALFFSLYPYKIKPYLYLLVPVIALVVDYGYLRRSHTRGFRNVFRATSVLYAIVFLALGVFAYRAEIGSMYWVLVALAVAGASVVFGFKNQVQSWLIAAMVGVLVFRALANSIGETDMRDLRAWCTRDPVACTHPMAMVDEHKNIWHEVGLISVGIEKPIRRLSSMAEAKLFVEQGGVVLLNDDQWNENEAVFSTPGVKAEPWSRWKVRAKFPYKELLLNGKSGIPDFEERTKRIFRIVHG